VLFKDESGQESEAQLTAFEDTWHWDKSAAHTYHEIIQDSPAKVAEMIGALHSFIGENQMMAYLVMMTARLVELHRVLKAKGSLYIHCDPTASHYLKVILDSIFGVQNFRNEIVWKRTSSHNDTKRFGRIHDVLFLYSKTDEFTFNVLRKPLDPEYVAKVYTRVDENGRRYRLDNISAPGGRGPIYEWGGITKAWRYTKEKMEQLYQAGRIRLYPDGRAMINAYVRYLDESEGQPIQDWWDDIEVIAAPAKERLGYPTQKPLSLLERIVGVSSNAGEMVLDPFCGCGTAIAAAQKLNREWIGIDITHLAISLQKYRLKDTFSLVAGKDYKVIGEPVDLASAKQLAVDDRYQFQWWALSLVGAKPLGGESDNKQGKKGKDKGVDGVINFVEAKGEPKKVLVQVKSGKVKSGDIRDLHGTIEREKAAIGIFITLEPPTKDMEQEALSAGFYTSALWQKDYPMLQILTIEQLLDGVEVKMPPSYGTFKQAEKIKKTEGEQLSLI
jgi:site-specific DNA-methyltransferase (adenine-specific)